jgi:hypothetical protein
MDDALGIEEKTVELGGWLAVAASVFLLLTILARGIGPQAAPAQATGACQQAEVSWASR